MLNLRPAESRLELQAFGVSIILRSQPCALLSQVLREDGGFDYKKAIVESILILIREIPDAKESGLAHLCEFIEVRPGPVACRGAFVQLHVHAACAPSLQPHPAEAEGQEIVRHGDIPLAGEFRKQKASR